MAISKPMRFAITALTRNASKVNIKKGYKLARSFSRATHPQLLKPLYKPWDNQIFCGDHRVPVRIFTPDGEKRRPEDLLLFIHGGGWVMGDIDSYSDVCILMARQTGCRVVSVDYRLAPEHPFPAGLKDCLAAEQSVFLYADKFGVDPGRITLIGDSAGGNLAAALSLLLRDRGKTVPARQILLYPSTNYDHDPKTSPYASIRTNGWDNMLTSQRVEDYVDLYKSSDKDLHNPYFAPLTAKDFSHQPKTLLLSAQYDPLRDEGEAYGHCLENAGNWVRIRRLPDCLHGFLSLPGLPASVRAAYQNINAFLDDTEKE
ncbi:MAG: alpha/beta hydrolase [Oscillospiraceae bacterium]|jgi:acetyl esterase|nr:alpha/beta hydrolase [Oscillospiraceae bacterium]